jgi:AraC-like DNA-binding protein
MKVLKTDISRVLNSYVTVTSHRGQRFSNLMHSHPELELVYIKSGSGRKAIGGTISNFNEGDIVLMGSELPHRWICDSNDAGAHAIVAYFNKDVFSDGFYTLKESHRLAELFSKAKRGLSITGATKGIVAGKIENLMKKSGFKKIIALMDIFHFISVSPDVEYITYENNTSASTKIVEDRLTEVYQYIGANYQNDISLSEIAIIANLTVPAFCRLFKQRTGKSFIDYLNEIRITAACRYLQDTDLNISTICTRCGFKNISNFNKRFKIITGFSPKEYRYNILALEE